jgi:leucyl-tRNA synthetase
LISTNQDNINLGYKLNFPLAKENDDLVRTVHIAIKGITNDISNDFQFNTVISKYRELTNAIYDWQTKKSDLTDEDKNVLSFAIVSLIKLMSPVAVHLTEEAWSELGGEGSIHEQPWCEWDENLAKSSSITLVVQINGKVKDKIEVDDGLSDEEMKQVAQNSPKIKSNIDGKTVVKVIVVPRKLVNIVVK